VAANYHEPLWLRLETEAGLKTSVQDTKALLRLVMSIQAHAHRLHDVTGLAEVRQRRFGISKETKTE